MRDLLRLLPLLALACTLAAPQTAAAGDETWCVLPFTHRGVDEATVHTFSELLRNELQGQGDVTVITSDADCRDSDCAVGAARLADAQVALFGSLGTLGKKTIVTVTAVDVESGETRDAHRMAVDQVEDLEAVASRLATSLVHGTPVEETVELGKVTRQESKLARRRKGRMGPGLRIGTILPLNDGYAQAGTGIALDGSLFYETLDFAIEGRTGIRFDAKRRDGNHYVEVPLDIGGYWLLGRGDFSVLVGGGAGVRYLHEERLIDVVTPGVISTRGEKAVDDAAWAFGYFARAGVMLLRTYTARVAITVDYNMLLTTLHGETNPQSLTVGLGVML